jgi:hypothetical protein
VAHRHHRHAKAAVSLSAIPYPVSDEALEDLDSYSAKIIAKRTQASGSRKTYSRPNKPAQSAATLETAPGVSRAGNSQKFSADVNCYKTFWKFFLQRGD